MMNKMQFYMGKFLRDIRGVAAIEFAMLAPILLTALIGIAELSNYMMAARRVTAAAHTAADLISQETDITDSELSEIFKASRLVMAPFDDSSLSLGAASVRFDDEGAASEDWNGNYNSGPISNALGLAAGLESEGKSVIIVSATYNYTPVLNVVMSGSYTLTETAILRPRYIDYVGKY